MAAPDDAAVLAALRELIQPDNLDELSMKKVRSPQTRAPRAPPHTGTPHTRHTPPPWSARRLVCTG
jgi:hypothetical protein